MKRVRVGRTGRARRVKEPTGEGSHVAHAKDNPVEAKDADEAYNLASAQQTKASQHDHEEAVRRATQAADQRFEGVDLDAAMRPESGATIPQQGEALNRKIQLETDGTAKQVNESDLRAQIDPRPPRQVEADNPSPLASEDPSIKAEVSHAGDAPAPGRG